MKFTKGQKVLCKAQQNEWNPIIKNFNRSINMALGYESIPKHKGIYTIKNPLYLFYENKCYIELIGFNGLPLDEKAFEPLCNQNALQQEELETIYN